MDAPIGDPYRHCEVACHHDLSRGVTIAELFEADGPYPAGTLLAHLAPEPGTLFDDEQRPITDDVPAGRAV
jgi:hypothetical protein